MKKQSVAALVLFLLIPLVTVLGGILFSLINPEIAAGHPNYVLNYHLLNLLKIMSFWASVAGVAVLWVLVCLLVIRPKQRSYLWLFLAALGPLGFAALASLNDRTTEETASCVRRLAAVRASLSVASSVTPVPSGLDGVTPCSFARALICADAPWTSTTRMLRERSTAISTRMLAKFSSVTIAPSTLSMKDRKSTRLNSSHLGI